MDRPYILKRIADWIKENPANETWIHAWMKTETEIEIAKRLEIPIYGPSINEGKWAGTKVGSRVIFREAHIKHAPGIYHAIYNTYNLCHAIWELLEFKMANYFRYKQNLLSRKALGLSDAQRQASYINFYVCQ